MEVGPGSGFRVLAGCTHGGGARVRVQGVGWMHPWRWGQGQGSGCRLDAPMEAGTRVRVQGAGWMHPWRWGQDLGFRV